ncbi:hypothetical protein JS609_02805 [Bacillus subtilis]|uniref:hypothetical protein n=1 Tax=Bacillus subtilis group TaxID=653685 RepID=UPI0007E51E87|nr:MULTISPECIES: hypothetical protein [Bacillus subtilis group]MED4649329.1 hypothetical protein [Bacillus inaquosorum]MED4790334.1 hypothetical protein [Bacillus inaquosorum]OAY89313.1 hypothetical protein AWM78_01550 [Bacillus subtilis subsp. subtilis]QAW34123.1 hypothetical protein ETK61_15450 [Bacillus subtilis]QYX67858.1 hypothetical protein K3G18_14345 [Bacillus subtilis]
MKVFILMSNKKSFEISYEDMKDVENLIDYFHDELDGERVLKNRLIDLGESILINPTQITHIEIVE